MVRQLIYDFREWTVLEAIGRSGSDDGIDIRAVQSLNELQEVVEGDEQEQLETVREVELEQRIWFIQCKRYQKLGPRQVEKIVTENLANSTQPPHGYILVAPCDFSLTARETLVKAARKLGVRESYVLGKAELEDMLFRPYNDHLLFAYFGVSLQIRRRSSRTHLRSILTLKRALIKQLGDLRQRSFKHVLIRDPEDAEYPRIEAEGFWKQPKWRYYEFFGHQPVNHVAFVRRKCYGYFNHKSQEWDALVDYDIRDPYPELFDTPDEPPDRQSLSGEYHELYFEELPSRNRAWYLELGFIPYDRILAIDEVGDACNEGPHLLVDFRAPTDPFEPRTVKLIEPTEGGAREIFNIQDLKQTDYLRRLRDRRRSEKATQSEDDLYQGNMKQMAQLREEFIQNTALFISNWYEETASRFIRNNADNTGQLGNDGVAELKGLVTKLQERAEEIVRSNLEEPTLWWDLEPSNQSYAYYGARPPEALDQAVRYAAGHLGPLLKTAGYLDSREVWRKQSERYIADKDAKPYYPNWLEWSEDMRTLIEQYDSQYAQARRRARDRSTDGISS
jgi:hypothetical protein